jgi:hypothetical protein
VKTRPLHDLRLARLRLARPTRENLPAVLLEAMAACALIVTERGRFPELGSGRGQRRFLFTGGRERDIRRLEACALVLKVILGQTDLVTLRSGKTRRDGTCDSITNLQITQWTRLSLKRVSRALRDLRAAGYLTCHQPRKRYYLDDGAEKWRAFPVVRVVTITCFVRLGIPAELLQLERDKASRRQREQPAPIVDVRLQRAHQRIVRAQRMAAKRATMPRQTEAAAAAKIRELEARVRKRNQ